MTEEEIAFAKAEIALAKDLQAMSLEDEIAERCAMAGCNEKQRKLHKQQFTSTRKSYNPHPSERFVRWWNSTGWMATEEATDRNWTTKHRVFGGIKLIPIPPVKAYNCEVVREVYRTFLDQQRLEMQGLPPTPF
jgi:hypothetical protein